MIAALYVQTGGEYFGRPDVDPWDEPRDARLYQGPYPVVAHPPCQLWGPMANVNFARWGGEHNRPGNDGGCFAAALADVLEFGGVLEHPAMTRAWAAHGITKPSGIGWTRCADGWVCEVWQSAYGHLATKRTWLLYSGAEPPIELRWNRIKGTHRIGGPEIRCGKEQRASQQARRVRGEAASRSPASFAETLIELARHSIGVSK